MSSFNCYRTKFVIIQVVFGNRMSLTHLIWSTGISMPVGYFSFATAVSKILSHQRPGENDIEKSFSMKQLSFFSFFVLLHRAFCKHVQWLSCKETSPNFLSNVTILSSELTGCWNVYLLEAGSFIRPFIISTYMCGCRKCSSLCGRSNFHNASGWNTTRWRRASCLQIFCWMFQRRFWVDCLKHITAA